MNFFSHFDPYYHLQKYLSFLPNHPVCGFRFINYFVLNINSTQISKCTLQPSLYFVSSTHLHFTLSCRIAEVYKNGLDCASQAPQLVLQRGPTLIGNRLFSSV